MQLADVGRNEPCPCGSGRKYKKCCLAARDAARAIDPEIVAAVDRAIEDDDWEPLHDPIDAAMRVFERGAPLEHVRFWDDQIRSREPDCAELAKMCTAGWLGRCEIEIAYVLDRYELDAEDRDGLHVSLYLLRRFGALSPTVEELARLQVAERVERIRRFANAVSACGLTLEEVMAGEGSLAAWVDRVRPAVLSFAEWFALRNTPNALDGLWRSSIAVRVAEACLDRLEEAVVEDRRQWLELAAIALLTRLPLMVKVFAYTTAPRLGSATEQRMYEAIVHKRTDEALRGIMHRIRRETEDRKDFADAALLRAAIQSLQSSWR